jgi:hypothetical protein
MSLATALKDAVAYARPLQDPDLRRLWGTQIITMIGSQLTARAPGHRHLDDLALLAIPLVSVLVSFASVQARSHSTALGPRGQGHRRC